MYLVKFQTKGQHKLRKLFFYILLDIFNPCERDPRDGTLCIPTYLEANKSLCNTLFQLIVNIQHVWK